MTDKNQNTAQDQAKRAAQYRVNINSKEQVDLLAKAAELHGMDSVPAFIRSTAIRAARDIVGE